MIHMQLIRHNSFQRIWWINELGGLTGYSLVLVHYIGTGKLWRINENPRNMILTILCGLH